MEVDRDGTYEFRLRRWPEAVDQPISSAAKVRVPSNAYGGTRRDRFVRCFITKLLTYANGVEPGETDFAVIDKILAKSAENDYRIVETISAVIDSPLFREE